MLAQSTLHIITPGLSYLLHLSPAELSGEYAPIYALQGAMGLSSDTHLRLSEPRHHCCHQ